MTIGSDRRERKRTIVKAVAITYLSKNNSTVTAHELKDFINNSKILFKNEEVSTHLIHKVLNSTVHKGRKIFKKSGFIDKGSKKIRVYELNDNMNWNKTGTKKIIVGGTN